ncbi:hypothetical protein [Defluviicoccus vanus]|uniref:Uncharacterized protein n=1 Tax=Defluviicoccus vanus TaxID=111831 RepID=A0A7H1N0Y5_9PROT|nr:hypothetical protein [Defluviicoccus vanus]QNT69371.1 hypothetical protein HQ394_08645 [Defluviicoccus vanus]
MNQAASRRSSVLHRRAPPIILGVAVFVMAVFVSVVFDANVHAAEPPVTTTSSADVTIFSVAFADCTARLIRQAGEAVLTYENACHQELDTKVATLARMLDAALPGRLDRADGAMLRVASLAETFPEFAKRLAQAASRSPEWYGERAKRDPGFGNPLVVKVANTTPIYRELQEALRPLDLRVQLVRVANVQVALPADTPFRFWLADRGVNPREQVPFDAEAWFRVAQ